jgi:hypothetical protein
MHPRKIKLSVGYSYLLYTLNDSEPTPGHISLTLLIIINSETISQTLIYAMKSYTLHMRRSKILIH